MDSVYLFVLARVLLASVFIGLGIERLYTIFRSGGLSSGATAFAVVELVAGLLLALGWQTRWMAVLLGGFLLVDALLAHPFWRFDGPARHDQLLHFLKNVSMLGGFLLLALAGTRG